MLWRIIIVIVMLIKLFQIYLFFSCDLYKEKKDLEDF